MRIPKTVFVTLRTLKLGDLDALICFNDGAHSRTKVMEALGIKVRYLMEYTLHEIDQNRIREAALNHQKLARMKKKK